MPEQWTLNITAKSEIKVPADVQEQMLKWHGGKRKAVADLRRAARVSVDWGAVRAVLTVNLAERKEREDAAEARREALRTLRIQRDWALAGFKTAGNSNPDTEEVATSIAGLTKESVEDVVEQLAFLDEEE